MRLFPTVTAIVALAMLAMTAPVHASDRYAEAQARLASGWNTFDTHSALTQVLMPQGLGIHLGFEIRSGPWQNASLPDVQIGRHPEGEAQVFPGAHSYDGSYTTLRVVWHGNMVEVTTAHVGRDLVIRVTPVQLATQPPRDPLSLIVTPGFLWQQPGSVELAKGGFLARGKTRTDIFVDGRRSRFFNTGTVGPYLALDLTAPVTLSTGKPRTAAEIDAAIAAQQAVFQSRLPRDSADIHAAIETVLGWDTIYEPEEKRVFSAISRQWNLQFGGYVIPGWDDVFAASLAADGSGDLAYANVIETLRSATPQGFVPNYARSGGWKSFDHSEPPVGALTVMSLYRRFHDKWFLQDAFQPLLDWNRWRARARSDGHYLVYGTDPAGLQDNDPSVGTRLGATFESGLDNSPMYDPPVVFDETTHRLRLADVGLMSLYIADCDNLAAMADILGKPAEAKELRERSAFYRQGLATLWDDKTGIFHNKDLVTGQLSPRLSPTLFYPLLANAATPGQARRMITEHLLNPDEFAGTYVLPMTPRNDPAFKDQTYWRGRIWAPVNYLVYVGLCNYDAEDARKTLADKSLTLFNGEWQGQGHVHENYNAMTGSGDDGGFSDPYYHWGALLAYMSLKDDAGRSVACD